MSEREPYDCPMCGWTARLIVGPTQALCSNPDDAACSVIMFNPSLPDGGMSDPQIITTSGWYGPTEETP